MSEKRKFKRYKCKIPVKFNYYEGTPNEVDIQSSTPIKGKGYILDISKGGVFIVSNSRVNVEIPIQLKFKKDKKHYSTEGIIVRTGFLKDNPSEIATRLSNVRAKGNTYIAIKFNIAIEDII